MKDDHLWGSIWLPLVLDAIGGFDGNVKSVRLHFEYQQYATAIIADENGVETTRLLPLFGTNVVSAALGAPKGLQAITVDIEKDKFVITNCRYAAIEASLDDLLVALKVEPVHS